MAKTEKGHGNRVYVAVKGLEVYIKFLCFSIASNLIIITSICQLNSSYKCE